MRKKVIMLTTMISVLSGYFYLSCKKIEVKKQEQIRIEQEEQRLKNEQIEKEKLEKERQEQEKLEQEQLEQEKLKQQQLLENTSQANQSETSQVISQEKTEVVKKEPKPTHVGRVRLEGDLATVELGEEMNREMELIPSNVVDSFFNNGGEVVITSYNIATTYYKDTSLGSIAGLFMGKENKIYIAHRKGCIRRAAIHEFGHYADKALNHISQQSEFTQIYNEEKNTFVEPSGIDKHYARSSVEFFAEVFAQSILNPDICKNTAPKAYEFVTNAIKNI